MDYSDRGGGDAMSRLLELWESNDYDTESTIGQLVTVQAYFQPTELSKDAILEFRLPNSQRWTRKSFAATPEMKRLSWCTSWTDAWISVTLIANAFVIDMYRG
jgi:hypothetical protein